MAEAPSDPAPTEAPAPEAPTPDKKKPDAAAPEAAATEAPAATPATPPAAEPSATTPAEAPTATPTPSPAPVSHPRKPPQRPLRPQPPAQTTVPGPTDEPRADGLPPWKPGEGPEGDTVPKAAPTEAPKATPPEPAQAPAPVPTPAPADAPAAKPDETAEEKEAAIVKAEKARILLQTLQKRLRRNYDDAKKKGEAEEMIKIAKKAQQALKADPMLVGLWQDAEEEAIAMAKSAPTKKDDPSPGPSRPAPPKKNGAAKSKPQKPEQATKKTESKPDAATDDAFKPKVEGYGIPGRTGLVYSTVDTDVAMAAKAAFATAYKSRPEVRARINRELADLKSRTLEVYHCVWQLRDGQNWVVPSEDAQVSLDRAVMARNAYIARMRAYVCEVVEKELSSQMLQLLDDFKFADSKTAVKDTKVLERDPYTEKQVPVAVDNRPLTMSSRNLLSAKTRQIILEAEVRKKREALSEAKSDKVRDKLSEELRLLNRETLMLDAAIKQIEVTWDRAKAKLAQDIMDEYPESKAYRNAVIAKDAVTMKFPEDFVVGDASVVRHIGSALIETGALDGMYKDVSELRTSAAAAQSDLDKKLGLADTFRGRAFGNTITLANAVRTLQALSRLPSFEAELVGQVPEALSSQVTNATVLGGVMRGPRNQTALIAAIMPPAMTLSQATPTKRTA